MTAESRPIRSRDDLYDALGEIGQTRLIVEIGVHKGANAQQMARRIRPTRFWLVDPWDGSSLRVHRDWNACMREAHDRLELGTDCADACVWLRMRSTDAAIHVPDGLDFVYIDGDHRWPAVYEDIATWWPKLRTGGVLAGHDFEPHRAMKYMVVPAVLAAFGPHARRTDEPAGTWVVRKAPCVMLGAPPDPRRLRKDPRGVPILRYADLACEVAK